MRLTRRGWIGGAALLAGGSLLDAGQAEARATAAVSPPWPPAPAATWIVRSSGAGHDYRDVLEALQTYALAELAAVGLPGMTLSVTDAEGFQAVIALGWADVERRVPVDPGHYFQIGSISKSFIAQTVLALSDQGLIDLDAPLARYLPDVALPAQPITVAQVLSHSAGLPDGAPLSPRTPDARLWTGFPPGSHFSYSNTGYDLLGRLIERLTGESHQAAVKRLVRDKLGLGGMVGTIAQSDRPRFAVGYWPWDQTVAATLPGARLEAAYWTEEDTPAGSVGGTSEQLAIYLRHLMRLGAGQATPVLSAAAAKRFATPVIPSVEDFGPGSRYACGVSLQPVDGVDCLHHTGGMMSFSSSFHVDPAAGVGAFASVNARNQEYRPRQTTAYAVRLMRAVRAGKPLPSAPDPLAPQRFKDPSPFLGTFVGPDGATFTLAAATGGVRLSAFGVDAAVVPQGPNRLVTDHPRLGGFGFDAVRTGETVSGYWWGETLFGRNASVAQPAPAEKLKALAGVYLNRDPWIGGGVVLVRGDRLIVDGVGPVVDRGEFWTAEKDPLGVERLRFEAPLGGRPQRLNISGNDTLRITV